MFQVVLVYNGEIYNFKALRPESSSDGEALLPLYLSKGDLFTRNLADLVATCRCDMDRRDYLPSGKK